MTRILNCTCISTYQDKKYGLGRRVKNERVKDMKHRGWACTVCGKKDET